MPRPAAALGLVALVGIIVMACSPSAVASLLPSEPGPLVTVTTRGGECVNGPCRSIIEIARNGTVTEVLPRSMDIGTVPADVMAALDAAIVAADFDAIRAQPFTGECPVNFDGQEIIYEFGAPARVERIATCETEIDPDHPLFVATTAALAAGGAR
jgi:hypothetical protein